MTTVDRETGGDDSRQRLVVTKEDRETDVTTEDREIGGDDRRQRDWR